MIQTSPEMFLTEEHTTGQVMRLDVYDPDVP
jgi:hypothetical protein